jgi:hypothetical protein
MKLNRNVLADAIFNSFIGLGISLIEMEFLLGVDYRDVLNGGIDPESEAGKKGFVVMNSYQLLFNMSNGDNELIKRWMHQYCADLHMKPYDLLAKPDGINRLHKFLSSTYSADKFLTSLADTTIQASA